MIQVRIILLVPQSKQVESKHPTEQQHLHTLVRHLQHIICEGILPLVVGLRGQTVPECERSHQEHAESWEWDEEVLFLFELGLCQGQLLLRGLEPDEVQIDEPFKGLGENGYRA